MAFPTDVVVGLIIGGLIGFALGAIVPRRFSLQSLFTTMTLLAMLLGLLVLFA
jgi:hypothetical protein